MSCLTRAGSYLPVPLLQQNILEALLPAVIRVRTASRIPYHTIPYHTIPYHTIPYHTIPYRIISHRTYCIIPFAVCDAGHNVVLVQSEWCATIHAGMRRVSNAFAFACERHFFIISSQPFLIEIIIRNGFESSHRV